MIVHLQLLVVLTVVTSELLGFKLPVDKYQMLHRTAFRHSWQHIQSDEPTRLVKFSFYNQRLTLLLSHNHLLFHPMAVAMVIDKNGNSIQHPINARHQYYTGHVVEQTGLSRVSAVGQTGLSRASAVGQTGLSRVSAHISEDGIVTAVITTSDDDVIYVEPSSRYSADSIESMIVYKKSDLQSPLSYHHNTSWFCGHGGNSSSRSSSHGNLEEGMLRRRRQMGGADMVCRMHLVGDHLFFRAYGQNSIDSSILYLANLLQTADQVFRNTAWEPTTSSYGLQVGNITLYTDPGGANFNEPIGPDGDRWTEKTLLQEFAYNDWSDYCLAHLFTSQSFGNDVLGYAFIASPTLSNQGGICSPYKQHFPGSSPSTPGTANVGLSSFHLLADRPILQPETEHIFTHEVGHNWGSEHDIVTAECNPPFGPSGGKYLMYASILDNSQPNNNVFSPCSIRAISRVLRSKHFCFSPRLQGLCGNYIVDPGEQCDAGMLGYVNMDECCHSNCTLKENATCSDKNELCCQSCKSASSAKVCVNQTGQFINCLESSYCNGIDSTCPQASGRPNNSVCIDSGRCVTDPVTMETTCRTFCEHMFNMQPCVCDVPNDCRFCCHGTGANGTCVAVDPSKNLPNGKPCEGGTCVDGACDLKSRDLGSRLYDFIQTLSSDTVARAIRENIVGSVVVITAVIYVPACVCVSILDWYTERKYLVLPLLKKFIRLQGCHANDETDSVTGSTERLVFDPVDQ